MIPGPAPGQALPVVSMAPPARSAAMNWAVIWQARSRFPRELTDRRSPRKPFLGIAETEIT
jgi:hypothetical protein